MNGVKNSIILIPNNLNSKKNIKMSPKTVVGNLIDIFNKRIYPARVTIEQGRIAQIDELIEAPEIFILPGFTDAHIHIESSMLTPYEFARKALIHGTVATVSDPHEIANVCGMEGVMYMLENARDARLKIHFGAPSCVPATQFETAGANLGPGEVEKLLKRDDIWYLSEMMNYPGVLFRDPDVMKKIELAKAAGKPVDGHAPGLMGEDARKYIETGISTDHECFTKEEALGKLRYGMKILIREGSAARNFEALHELISEFPDQVMLCSDDKHPDELIHGHINQLVARAIEKGHSLFDVLQCACVNPVLHYRLNVGLLRPGDSADFIMTTDVTRFDIHATWINGEQVTEGAKCMMTERSHPVINHFSCDFKSPSDFAITSQGKTVRIIDAIDGQLVTRQSHADLTSSDGLVQCDTAKDILKIAVVNRYNNQPPAIAFIRNFGLQSGAIASTVAHDSHNIIAVGADDESICRAVNLLIENKGGLSAVDAAGEQVLALPIAGLMSDKSCETIGEAYSLIDKKVKQMGCRLRAPYMTLSFMALLVIPSIKLSDKGLFDGEKFCFTPLFL